MSKVSHQKRRHRIFINPYVDCAFTKCPKCSEKTKVRKFPLVVHVEPSQMLLLNMGCKYCNSCDLIIVKHSSPDNNVTNALKTSIPSLVGRKYLAFGTVDRSIWRASRKQLLNSSDLIDNIYVFEEKLDFTPAWKP